MKPKTKIQLQIAGLSKQLAPLSYDKRVWAFDRCLKHIGYRNKSRISCLDCGYLFEPQKGKRCTCPKCNKKLEIIDTRKLNLKQETYFVIVDTCNGFQVNRYFELTSHHKVGTSVKHYVWEVCQQWILPNGKYEFFARRHKVNYCTDSWCGDFAFREKNPPRYYYYKKDLYNLNPAYVYPEINILPELKRNGFKSKFCNISPLDLFLTILKDNKAESLLKMKQYDILKFYIYNHNYLIDRYWSSIKIAVRNNYKIKDSSIWFDYLELLSYFKKDLHNSKYVCPQNLKSEHDRLVAKKKEREEKEETERKRLRALENEEKFKALKSKFFGLCFSDGLIQIKTLESVQEFLEEGNAMHHCVFTNEYYLKPDSLILSAMIEGKRIETVEVSLKTLKVVQSRGVCNNNTKYHDRIIKLVNKNKKLIQKQLTV